MVTQIYLDGMPSEGAEPYRGYYRVTGHAVYYRVPGRERLMKDFHIAKQHCSQMGIETAAVEPVIVVLHDGGWTELSKIKTEP